MTAVAAKFDLLAVRSAETDRRALSQAWYSALHLASGRAASAARREDSALPDARVSQRGKCGSPAFRSRHPWLHERVERSSPNVARVAQPQARPELERRERVSALARSIVLGLRFSSGARSVTLSTPHGRVCVYLVPSSRGTQVLALCPPAARAVVEKALAQVRYAIAGGAGL